MTHVFEAELLAIRQGRKDDAERSYLAKIQSQYPDTPEGRKAAALEAKKTVEKLAADNQERNKRQKKGKAQ